MTFKTNTRELLHAVRNYFFNDGNFLKWQGSVQKAAVNFDGKYVNPAEDGVAAMTVLGAIQHFAADQVEQQGATLTDKGAPAWLTAVKTAENAINRVLNEPDMPDDLPKDLATLAERGSYEDIMAVIDHTILDERVAPTPDAEHTTTSDEKDIKTAKELIKLLDSLEELVHHTEKVKKTISREVGADDGVEKHYHAQSKDGIKPFLNPKAAFDAALTHATKDGEFNEQEFIKAMNILGYRVVAE